MWDKFQIYKSTPQNPRGKKNQCPIEIMVRPQTIFRPSGSSPQRWEYCSYTLISEAGSYDNKAQAGFELGNSPASAYRELE